MYYAQDNVLKGFENPTMETTYWAFDKKLTMFNVCGARPHMYPCKKPKNCEISIFSHCIDTNFSVRLVSSGTISPKGVKTYHNPTEWC